MYILNHVFLKLHMLTLCIGSQTHYILMYPSFVMHLPEDGHMSGQNMYEVYYVYNILSYTFVHLLVLATTSDCLVHSYGSHKS